METDLENVRMNEKRDQRIRSKYLGIHNTCNKRKLSVERCDSNNLQSPTVALHICFRHSSLFCLSIVLDETTNRTAITILMIYS